MQYVQVEATMIIRRPQWFLMSLPILTYYESRQRDWIAMGMRMKTVVVRKTTPLRQKDCLDATILAASWIVHRHEGVGGSCYIGGTACRSNAVECSSSVIALA